MQIVKDKIAIVTGAGSGIGRAIAQLLAQEGAKVVVSDINEQGAQETLSTITAAGGIGIVVLADVSKVEDNERLVKETIKQFGRLDIAVNNAGIGGPIAPTGDYPVDGWNKVIAVNLSSVFYAMRFQIPRMIKSGGGAIVNISSILGQVGFKGSPAYVAAKHGLIGLTKNAALDHATDHIRVNAVGPAFIRTPMVMNGLPAEAVAGLSALHPMGRLGEPNEVAELVLWLSSAKASFVTGSYYAVDGGYLAQ